MLDFPPYQIFCEDQVLFELSQRLSKQLNLQYNTGFYESDSYLYLHNAESCIDTVASASMKICVYELDDGSILHLLVSDYCEYCDRHRDVETPGEVPQSHLWMQYDGSQGLRVLAAYWKELPIAHFVAFVADLLRKYRQPFNLAWSDQGLKDVADQLQGENVVQAALPENCCGSGTAFLSLPGPAHLVLLCNYPALKEVLDPAYASESTFILILDKGQFTTYQLAVFQEFCKNPLPDVYSTGLESSHSSIHGTPIIPSPPLRQPGMSRPTSSRLRMKGKKDPAGFSSTRPKLALEDDNSGNETKPPSTEQKEEVRQSGSLKRKKLSEARLFAESQGEIKGLRVLVGCTEDWNEQSDAHLAQFFSYWKVHFYLCDSNSQFKTIALKLPGQIAELAEDYWSSGTAFLNMPADENCILLASWPVFQQAIREMQLPENTFLVYRVNKGEIQSYFTPQEANTTSPSRSQSSSKHPAIRPTSAAIYASKLLKQTEEMALHREKQLQSLQIALKSRLERVKCRVVPSKVIATTQETAMALLLQSLDAMLAVCVGKLTELGTERHQALLTYTENLILGLEAPTSELLGLLTALPSQALQEAVLRMQQLKQAYEASQSSPAVVQAMTELWADETALCKRLECTAEAPHFPYSLSTAKLQTQPYLIVRTKRPNGQTPVVFMKTEPYLQITVQNSLHLNQDVLFVPLALSPGVEYCLSLWENQEKQVSKPISLSSSHFEALQDLDWEGGAALFHSNQYQLSSQTS